MNILLLMICVAILRFCLMLFWLSFLDSLIVILLCWILKVIFWLFALMASFLGVDMACRFPGYYLPIKGDNTEYDPFRHCLVTYDNPYDYVKTPQSKKVHGRDYLLAFDPEKVKALKALDPEHEGSEIPCGRCFGCRLNHRKERTYRLCNEAEMYDPDHVWFLTFTYDDMHVPFGLKSALDHHTGELYLFETHALKYRDFDLWRMRFSQKMLYRHGHSFRHFSCGEYGAQTLRPHYHSIIFGLSEEELAGSSPKWWNRRKNLRTSDELSDSWGLGRVVYAPACYETMEYVAGYVLKKSIGIEKREKIEEFYAASDLPIVYESFRGKDRPALHPEMAPFEKTFGSNRPGIGRAWYEQHKGEVYQTDEMTILRKGRALHVKPVSYYDDLFEDENPGIMPLIKIRRKVDAENLKAVKLAETGYDEKRLLELQLELDAAKVKESLKHRGDTCAGHI